jgi:hypothetical protein
MAMGALTYEEVLAPIIEGLLDGAGFPREKWDIDLSTPAYVWWFQGQETAMSGLKYVGQGEWLPGVPARDLTDEEAAQYPEAAKSRLYEADTPKKQPRKAGEE